MRQLLRNWFFIGLLVFSLGQVETSQAADVRIPTLASVRDVAFAYAKLTGTTPTFSALMEQDQSYQALNTVERTIITPRLQQALQDQFAHYSPFTRPLTVRMYVRATPHQSPTGLSLAYFDEHLPSFAFWVGPTTVHLYAENLPDLMFLPLADGLAVKRAGYLLDSQNDLYLDLIPSPRLTNVRTDSRTGSHALMGGTITRAMLLNNGGRKIWEWTNPRFTYLYNNNIDLLYKRGK